MISINTYQTRQIIHHAAEGVGVQATARLLELDKDTINRVILRAGEHCARVLSSLLTSLNMTEGHRQANQGGLRIQSRSLMRI
jgi:hypothetical protein